MTSLAFNRDGATKYLYFWPYEGKLTALQLSDNSLQPGTGTIAGSGTTVTLNNNTCTFGSGTAPCFTNLLVAGDKITPSGQAVQTVTAVSSATQITVAPGFTGTTNSWTYNGFFINPIQDSRPSASGVGYAGGAITLTSNSGQNGLVWAILSGVSNPQLTTTRTLGSLVAYNAAPTQGVIPALYASAYTFCTAPFALPTAANGKIYVPTYLIGSSCPTTGSANPSGVLVYGTSH